MTPLRVWFPRRGDSNEPTGNNHGNNTERRQAGEQSADRRRHGGGQIHVEVKGGKSGGTLFYPRRDAEPPRGGASRSDGGGLQQLANGANRWRLV